MKPLCSALLLLPAIGCRSSVSIPTIRAVVDSAKEEYPEGADDIRVLGKGWSYYTWNAHKFLQHKYKNNPDFNNYFTIETIHLCHEHTP
jgi:chromosome segregation and condensation protein ScpB